MTREEVSSGTFDGTVTASTSETVEVQTGRATQLVVYVDDGTTGGAPASYSLDVDAQHDEFSDYHRQASVGAGTEPYHEFTANGSTMQVTLTDESAADNPRRILVKSYRSMD